MGGAEVNFPAVVLVVAVSLWLSAGEARSLRTQSSAECKPVAFILKAHQVSSRVLDTAVLAKQQVERCGGFFRVLFSTTNLSWQNDTIHAVSSLQKAVGDTSVVAVGPEDFMLAYGKKWEELTKMDNGRLFAWTHCDAAELTWFHLLSQDMPSDLRHVWIAEADVGWTGDLPYLLSVFPETADFVCYTDDMTRPNIPADDWYHRPYQNWLAQGEIRQCFIMLARYSRRLLQTFVAHTKMGNVQYCEMTGAVLCEHHKFWCRMHTFDMHHQLVGRREGQVLFRWNARVSPEMWADITAGASNSSQGHIYHALKW